MHLHNVAEYAPPGYRLERSDHEGGVCKHLFVSGGGPDLTCELTVHSAAEERAELQAFQAKHQLAAHVDEHRKAFARVDETAPLLAAQHEEHIAERKREASQNLVSEAAVRASRSGASR